MSSFSVRLPDELIDEMTKYPDIPWDQIIKKVIEEHLTKLAIADSLVENSEFTEEDAIEIGREINKSALKEFLKN